MSEKKILSGPGTVVGVNVKLVGALHDTNEIIVHGQIEGEVVSDKSVTIAETAYVKGPVSADIVQVGGQVEGSIVATGKLELLPTGKVFGSITTKDLNIQSGAIFVGKSAMPGTEKIGSHEEIKDSKEEKTEDFVKE